MQSDIIITPKVKQDLSKDMEYLQMVKEIESKHTMYAERIDSKTVVYNRNKKKLKEIADTLRKTYGKNKEEN